MEWYTFRRPDLHSKVPNRNKLLPVLLAATLVGILFLTGYAWASKSITLICDGQEKNIRTLAPTVGKLLQQEGIVLQEGDEVQPAILTAITPGMRIEVLRVRKVSIVADGNCREIMTSKKTVAEILSEQGIELSNDDMVLPQKTEIVPPGGEIKITRVEKKEWETEVEIPYPVRQKPSDQLARGITRVIKAGKPGKEKQVWQITYHDGREVARQLLAREVIVEPVERIVEVGTLTSLSRSGMTIRFSRALDVVATAYTYTGYNTASGSPPRVGVVAVDPNVIPIGSRLYVEGYGFAQALDVGSSIVGNKIDVFLESREAARRWGIRKVRVYILE